VELLSAIKLVPEMMYIVIPVVMIIILVYLAWQQVQVKCHTDLDSTSDTVLLNLNKCIENCWRKHDFGRDLETDDCYLIDVHIKDKELTRDDFTPFDYLRIDFDVLEPFSKHKVKIRYDGKERVINLVKLE